MISAGIVGGTGYTGVELMRLLARHPKVKVTVLTSRTEAGTRVDAMFPSLRGVTDLCFSDSTPDALAGCDVVFFATPHGVAMKQARELTDQGIKVIDLAADIRLQDTAVFEQWQQTQLNRGGIATRITNDTGGFDLLTVHFWQTIHRLSQ